jgi:aerobic carbon-monoxide dehydrogenase medium subunit
LLTHSNVRVRNVATVGGNLAHGDPHMDLPPLLIALGASVRVVGPSGERGHPGRRAHHRLHDDGARQ